MSELYVGCKVVCVDDKFSPVLPGEVYPVRGHQYRIRAINCDNQGIGVLLEEIVNEPQWYSNGFCECDFYVRRFRPVKSDPLAIFRKMCRDAERNVRVK